MSLLLARLTGGVVKTASVSFVGVGTLSLTTIRDRLVSMTFAGVGTFSETSIRVRNVIINDIGRGTFSLTSGAIRPASPSYIGIGTFNLLSTIRERLDQAIFDGVGRFQLLTSLLQGRAFSTSGVGKFIVTVTPLIDGTPSKPRLPGSGMYVTYPSVSPLDRSRFPQDNVGVSNV